MAAAGGEERKPVLEIYCGSGLGVYLMKPVNKGLEIFGKGDIVSPKGKDRVGIHSEVIGHGTLHTVVGDADNTFEPFRPDMNYEQPHVTNPNFDFLRVYENHPKISELVKKYNEGSSADPENATRFIDEVKSMTWEERREVKPGGKYWLAPEKRNSLRYLSTPVFNKVNAIKKKAKAAKAAKAAEAAEAAAAVGSGRDNGGPAEIGSDSGGSEDNFDIHGEGDYGGGSSRSRRRRRPSRKYKKSKRVLRRKSRSTRRR